jgi:site-specific recombinase
VENFTVYHRIPEAITQHPLGRYWGELRLKNLADRVERNIAGWATCISLGYMLGFLPDISHFFGIPLDVRHVTLSTGTLALAAARFGTSSFGHNWFYAAVAGIGETFVLNLGVSFSISAYVGMRAYNVPAREQLQLLGFLLKRIALSPLRFIFPIEQGREPLSIVATPED